MSNYDIIVSPSCPSCNAGKTWVKDRLVNKDFNHSKANCYCKSCYTEFYVPPKWASMGDDWKDEVEIF